MTQALESLRSCQAELHTSSLSLGEVARLMMEQMKEQMLWAAANKWVGAGGGGAQGGVGWDGGGALIRVKAISVMM